MHSVKFELRSTLVQMWRTTSGTLLYRELKWLRTPHESAAAHYFGPPPPVQYHLGWRSFMQLLCFRKLQSWFPNQPNALDHDAHWSQQLLKSTNSARGACDC